MRAVCATVLFFEAIVIGLATPVMITVQGVDRSLALALGLGLAAACLVAAGLLRSPVGYPLGHALQVAAIALGLVVPVMFFVGAMFAALWIGAWVLGRKIDADRARWAAEGGSDEPSGPARP